MINCRFIQGKLYTWPNETEACLGAFYAFLPVNGSDLLSSFCGPQKACNTRYEQLQVCSNMQTSLFSVSRKRV